MTKYYVCAFKNHRDEWQPHPYFCKSKKSALRVEQRLQDCKDVKATKVLPVEI